MLPRILLIFRTVLLFSLGLGCFTGLNAGTVTTLVQTPPETLKPGTEAVVWVYRLNEGEFQAAISFPERLICELRSQAGAITVEARRQAMAPAGEIILAPGAFCKVSYTVTMPPDLSGPLTLVLQDPAAIETPAPNLSSTLSVPSVPSSSDRLNTGSPAGAESAALPATPPPPVVSKVPDRLRLAVPQPDLFLLFSTYEPLYVVYSPDSPNIRYQVSFKSSLFNPDGNVAENLPWLRGLYVAYTQTSLWNFSAPSSPFYDTSYKPELFFLQRDVKWLDLPGVSRLDFQTGLQHESNGKDEENSRSMNLVYVKPTFYVGDPAAFHVTLAPRFFSYISDRSDNPDIADYRGHGDLTMTIGWPDGLQFASRLRAGDSLEHLTAQFDLTYPMHHVLPAVSPNLFLQAQYFNGYGESLLDYQLHSESLRFGIGLWR